MVALIVGFLMSIGIISTPSDFNSMTAEQQEILINAWGEDDEGI